METLKKADYGTGKYEDYEESPKLNSNSAHIIFLQVFFFFPPMAAVVAVVMAKAKSQNSMSAKVYLSCSIQAVIEHKCLRIRAQSDR